MITRLTTLAALAAFAFAPTGASASAPGMSQPDRDAAIEACLAFNEKGPARLIDVLDDGLGDYLVWIADVNGSRWACNASGFGEIYANLRIGDDLLNGLGFDLVHKVADTGWESPSITAERVCLAMGKDPGVNVIAAVADGTSGYAIWLQNGDGDLTFCNATGKGEVFAFQTVDTPINKPGLDEGVVG